ncbi:signal peptidase I [Alicyclobacillus sp. SO9]|uniref:signal peptidase I n=1 Tax=Alicyclobacillus sp. SO9 TaxID=2665646 RepID=UPI0018E733FE|nr:signal peptidase I [Alicyclobacillus sp. SO9]QQE78446.1 signal peptidase I [Alicyclobacillus sp. SO9]
MISNRLRKSLYSFLPVVFGVVVALSIKTWVISAAFVPSASMYPTIPALDRKDPAYITVDKLATELGHIHRGEVVVFHFPDDPSELFVKRVVGMPGNTVTVTSNAVYINGQKLNESNPDISVLNGPYHGTFHVPIGHYFMLGDNRPISDDSRMWVHKYVSRSAIVGKANVVFHDFTIKAISQSLTLKKRYGR